MENKVFFNDGRTGYCELHKRSYVNFCLICVSGPSLPLSTPVSSTDPNDRSLPISEFYKIEAKLKEANARIAELENINRELQEWHDSHLK